MSLALHKLQVWEALLVQVNVLIPGVWAGNLKRAKLWMRKVKKKVSGKDV